MKRPFGLQLALLIITCIMTVLGPGSIICLAHPANIAGAQANVQPDGHFQIRARFDLLAFALNDTPQRIGDAPMNTLLDGPNTALEAQLAEAKGNFQREFAVSTGGAPATIDSIDFPTAADVHKWAVEGGATRLPVMLPVVVNGHLPPNAATFSVRFPEVLGTVVLTTELPYQEPVSEPLDAGAYSTPLNVPTAQQIAAAQAAMNGPRDLTPRSLPLPSPLPRQAASQGEGGVHHYSPQDLGSGESRSPLSKLSPASRMVKNSKPSDVENAPSHIQSTGGREGIGADINVASLAPERKPLPFGEDAKRGPNAGTLPVVDGTEKVSKGQALVSQAKPKMSEGEVRLSQAMPQISRDRALLPQDSILKKTGRDAGGKVAMAGAKGNTIYVGPVIGSGQSKPQAMNTVANEAEQASARAKTAQVNRPPWWTVIFRYVKMGYKHILPEGLDHILFVLGLVLLSKKTKALLWQITAFTVAHSITLALSLYGIVRLPSSIVEPIIAASIAFVAIENILTTDLKPWRPFVVFAFGLVHGMGFAGALQDLGLARHDFLTALIGFNVGVELGQLSVVAMALLAIGWFRSNASYRKMIVIPGSTAIALVAIFWTIQRTL